MQNPAARATTDACERRLAALTRVDLLIIDDIGLKPLRPPQGEDFHHLLIERHELAATILTRNLDLDEWGKAFPNRLLGAAVLDRIRHGAYRIVLEGQRCRAPRPMPEPSPKDVAPG
ncbi:hypothetical protein JCM30394_32150 [Deferrisoma palaeochoriense]